jgi:hypothetical protein
MCCQEIAEPWATASKNFDHVSTAPDTAVDIDFDIGTDCIGYLRQNRNGR